MQDATTIVALERPRRWSGLLLSVGLVALVVVAHRGALSDGVDFDDYMHRANLRACGWSWHDLIEATTFDFPDRTMDYWWQAHPTQCRYPRPVFMLVLKLEYTLAGGNPVIIHAFGMAWHALAVLLIFHLARRLLASSGWAALAAATFALGAPSVLSVSWTAARNAVLGTLLLVAATDAYLAASFDNERRPRALQPALLLLAILCWALSTFSRETGIVFPALALALDLFWGGWSHVRRRLGVHALLIVLALLYVGWRLYIFPTGAFPAGYLETPHGLAYLLWAGSKLLQLTFQLLLQLPLFALANPADTGMRTIAVARVFMLVVVLTIVGLYLRLTRGQTGRLLGPLWMLLGLAATLPVSTLPHFGYLPFVGYALAVPAFLRGLPRRWRGALTSLDVLLLVGAFAAQRVLWRAGFRSEQLIYADIVTHTALPPPPDSQLFFINLPPTSTFIIFALEETWGPRNLKGHMLTIDTRGPGQNQPTHVERCGENELIVETAAPSYFASSAERLFLRMTAGPQAFHEGQVFHHELFDVTVLAVRDDGVRRLKFTFHKPVDTPGYYFYVSTAERPAYWLRFDATFTPETLARETAAWETSHARLLEERDRVVRLQRWWRHKRGWD